jgi:anti-sigma B factor antagonist
MNAQPAAGTWPVLVMLPAEIDASNAGDVRDQLTAAALGPGVRIVVADMTATTFCDSMGVRALLIAHRRAADNGADLWLLRPGQAVLRVLEIMGIDQVLTIRQSLEDAPMP